MNKFLTVVFVVLFAVLFVEIWYLFFGTNIKNKNSKSLTTNIIVSPSIIPSSQDNDQAISQQSIDRFSNLKIFKKGVLQSTTIKHILEGKITKIKKLSEITKESGSMANFTIEGKEGLSNSFFFAVNEINEMNIFEDKEKKLPLKFELLNVGDNIILEYDIYVYNYQEYDNFKTQTVTIIKIP